VGPPERAPPTTPAGPLEEPLARPTRLNALIFDWIPRSWRLFVLWFNWLWRHPMDNSTGRPPEPERPLTYTDEELKRAMDATIEAHRAKQRVRRD
jgi:hypothetical protein